MPNQKHVVRTPPCPGCGSQIDIPCTQFQAKQYLRPQSERPFVQDIFPELNKDQRERLISGTCPPCWDAMWREEDE